MPHLILCNRFWRLGGDELPIPAICAIFGRVFWIVLLSILFTNTNTDNIDCHSSLDAYLGLSASVFLCSIMCEFLIAYSGMQGTIVETEKRNRPLEYYLFIHYLLAFVEFACAIWGALIVSHIYRLPCSTDAVSRSQLDVLILTLVVVSQFVDTFILGFCGWILSSKPVNSMHIVGDGYAVRNTSRGGDKDSLNEHLKPSNNGIEGNRGSGEGATTSLTQALRHSRSSGSTRQNMFESTYDTYDDFQSQQQKMWAKRCSDLCKCMSISTCGIFGGVTSYQDIESVSKVLTQFFHHDGFLDVVPSDVIAGILLLRLQQRSVVKKLLGNHMHDRGSIRGVSDSVHLMEEGDLDGGRRVTDIESLQQPTLTRSLSLVDTLSNRTRAMMTASRRNLNKQSSTDWALTQELYRMSLYAFAVYTHLLYLYTKPCSGLCTLCYRSTVDCTQDNCCQPCCGPSKHNTLASATSTSSGGGREVPPKGSNVGDDCFHLNQSTVEAVLRELPGSEVLYASYKNDPTLKPYAIFADHSANKIVIAVRGTLSLEDCITDAICDTVELNEAANQYPNGFVGENRYAHGGFYRAAARIREDIAQIGILDSIYHTGGNKGDIEVGYMKGSPVNSSLVYTPGDWSHYGLVVVGHSLGAGVATILAMLLKGEYLSLVCYGFGTPGSTIDETTSQEISTYMTSVVLHNDMISRLGITSMNNIREQVLDTICRSKVNKTQILQTLFRDLPIEDVLYTPGTEPPSAFKNAVDSFNGHMRQVNDHDVASQVTKLVIPGRIIHYVKSKDRKYSRQFRHNNNNNNNNNNSGLANGGGGGEYGINEGEVMDIYHEDETDISNPNQPCQECCCDANTIKCGMRIGRCACCCCGPCMAHVCKTDAYIPQETSLEAFAELIVSPSMALDHFPDRYVFELKAVRESWKMTNIH